MISNFNAKPKTELQEKAVQKLTELFERAERKHLKVPKDLGINVDVSFNLTSVTTGGFATYNWTQKTMTLEFHKNALETYSDEYINQTVTHEFCHLICYLNYPSDSGHGKFFKSLMRNFGAEPKRCHNYDLRQFKPSRAVRKTAQKFEYRCDCMVHPIGKTRHNNIQKAKTSFHCKHCRKTLVYVNEFSKGEVYV